MDHLDSIPPVVRILLDEQGPSTPEPAELTRWYRPLHKELRRQAEWTSHNFEYSGDHATAGSQLAVTASGSVNPLSDRAVCFHPECRVAAATRFARTLGLYAETVTIPDTLTEALFRRGKLKPLEILSVAGDVAALKALAPLIRAGIVRFRRHRRAFCEEHFAMFEEEIGAAIPDVVREIIPDVRCELSDEAILIHAGQLGTLADVIRLDLTPTMRDALSRGATLQEVAMPRLQDLAHDALFETLIDYQAASLTHTGLASGARLDVAAVRALASIKNKSHVPEVLPSSTAIDLPWVSDLTPEQIVQLREQAQLALPRFREKLARAIVNNTAQPSRLDEVIEEIRAEAFEVNAEFAALDKKGESQFRNIAGLLGVTISVYGFAAGFQPAGAALGGLFSLLALLHAASRRDDQAETQLQSRPGYVLVKAKELASSHHAG